MKHILFIALLLSFQALFSQVEEQLKFDIYQPQKFQENITSKEKLGELSLYQHSTYAYYDIYFDTPDRWFFKNGYSLRIRKRVKDSNDIEYVLQLKSEMTSESADRKEVDSKNIGKSKITHKGESMKMSVFLDTLFSMVENKSIQTVSYREVKAYRRSLNRWMTKKIQKKKKKRLKPLKAARKMIDDDYSITKISPVLIGKSIRNRSHVYVASNNNGYKTNDNKKLSDYLEKGNYNWLAETSFDSSVFYYIRKKKRPAANILEFEVENKHEDKEEGKKALQYISDYLIKNDIGQKKFDSKFKQAISLFLNK